MAVLNGRVSGAWVPLTGVVPSSRRLTQYANPAARDAVYTSPEPGDLCQCADTSWIWWYRSAGAGWVPLYASASGNSASWGSWGTELAVSPPGAQDINPYLPAGNQLYGPTTKFLGTYTLKVYFAASSSDPGYFSIMSNLGGLNSTSSQMSWAIATHVAVGQLGPGAAITFQLLKNVSQVAWPSSTIKVSLMYSPS
jgi:hypothetical protein